jgi:F0F1-type ATP synthase, subunit a
MIVAAESCDIEGGIVCTPSNVNELFVFKPIFYIGETGISRTHFLILFAAFLVVIFLFAGLRKKSVVPSKIQSVVESLVTLIREDIAMSVIGKGGEAYVPYLLSIFMFILVGNLFEVAPLINFPITSRIAIPLLLSLITYVFSRAE